MKKLLVILSVLFATVGAKAQCDFSEIEFTTRQQQGNDYYFQTNMHQGECYFYIFTVWDYQRKVEDTLDDWGGWTGVTFNAKGKYEMRLNVYNSCVADCDTVLTIPIDITIFGKLGYGYNIGAKNCKYYTFELENRKDTCTEYYYQIYKGDDYINGLSNKEWKEVSDSALYFNYSWAEELIEYYSIKSERVLDYEFKDSGRYFILPMLYNTCSGIDTWAFKKLNVCLEFQTTSVKKITKETLKNVTVVGYYDLLGRHVDYIEPNKIYIVHYSDGRRQKVMRTDE